MKTCSLKGLAGRECMPCRGGVAALKGAELKAYLKGLGRGWKTVKVHHLEKEFRFKDFVSALVFTNRVGALAEEQGHHPDLYLAWGKVRVMIWTHAIDGLTEDDFVLAAKIEGLRKA
jgi:4a-hydroxytetrahydrobiopterin dehydratase